MSAENVERVAAIFRDVLDLPPDVDPRGARPRDTPTWDSLNHVMLVAALESEFGVAIDVEDSLEMTTFDSALALLSRAGVPVDVPKAGP